MFIIPTAFGGMLMYDNHRQTQYELTLESAADRGDLPRVKQLLAQIKTLEVIIQH
jgi:hypothetical protein